MEMFIHSQYVTSSQSLNSLTWRTWDLILPYIFIFPDKASTTFRITPHNIFKS